MVIDSDLEADPIIDSDFFDFGKLGSRNEDIRLVLLSGLLRADEAKLLCGVKRSENASVLLVCLRLQCLLHRVDYFLESIFGEDFHIHRWSIYCFLEETCLWLSLPAHRYRESHCAANFECTDLFIR